MDKILLDARKKMLLNLMDEKDYVPMRRKEIAAILQITRKDKDDLRQALDSLIQEGKIVVNEKGRYSLSKESTKEGVFSGTQRGFGFVIIEGEEEDIFVSPTKTKGALHNDKVLVRIEDERTGRRKEGEVIRIIERANKTLVGTFEKNKNFGFVVTDNQKFSRDIYIPNEYTKGAVTGHKVVVDITDYGDEEVNPEGKVVKILGHMNDPGVDIMSVIMEYNLPLEFSEGVLKQIETIPEEVIEKEKAGRKDLRHLPMVTIDGEDAKDLDDAVSISRNGNVYRLGVHIADVTHYVKENSPLDKEALKRGTSVYLVDRVIPMLPHKLSNGICSLNAGTDRLALSCIMDIDEKGNVIGHEIAETLINVDQRMSYTSVKKILEDKEEEEIQKYKEFVPMFELMQDLAKLLREKRRKRGSIDFDFPESKITLDKEGHPIDVKVYERNVATKIIEDFMLIANETVAQDFFWQELPFVYRSHENPDSEKLQQLGIFINNFGYHIKVGKGDIHPKELQKLLGKIENSPEEALISRLTLRSMKRAKYTTSGDGHFGLATKYYCHFTSPIRRYPDLQIHRIIKENLHGNLREERIKHYNKILSEVSNQSSIKERRADDAERDVEKMKKVEYMSQFVGTVFEGVISGVTAWGLYVELPNTIEGMVRMDELLDDYYHYDKENYSLVGEHTGKTYNLGEKVKVELVGTNKQLRTIDFTIA